MPATAPRSALPVLLGEIYLAGKTGVLDLRQGRERLGLAFRQGRIHKAETGEIVVVEPMDADLGDPLSRNLARILAELGIGRGSGTARPARSAGRDRVLAALDWAEPELTFAAQEVEVDPDDGLGVSTEELVLEAVRRLSSPDDVRRALGDVDRALGLAVNPDFDRELTPTDAYILSRVDGRLSGREVIQLVPQDVAEAERALLGLLLTGIVEFLAATRRPAAPSTPPVVVPPLSPDAPPSAPLAQPPAPVEMDEETRTRLEPKRRDILEAYEGLPTKNHFEVLGVTEGATDSQIKEAFFRQAKRFHPDSHSEPGFADVAERLQAVFLRIGGAYEVLRDPQSRASYEAVPSEPVPPRPGPVPDDPATDEAIIDSAENAWMAEEAIHRAERLLTDGKVWDSIQLLQRIVPQIYGKKQRERARVLLAKAYIKNPNWLRRGEELLQAVIQEDPQNAEAHYVLGMLYKESKMNSRAVNMFKKTLELRPEHKNAQTEMSSLSGPAFIRRLFGKKPDRG
jgi:curved DNA-binding protein CbpA